MANETTLIFETEVPIPMTCADGTGIEKGAILKLTDPMTCALSDGVNDIVAGIAAEEKIANDGKEKVSVYRRGIFKIKASGAITAGDSVGTSGENEANFVVSNRLTANLSGAVILGTALETAANKETLLVELNPQSMRTPGT